ncbi:MAG: DUF2269 family protein [Flavobacteriia bacterium]|nr:DUF2269 family protein [Flavobacteriia bacterium]
MKISTATKIAILNGLILSVLTLLEYFQVISFKLILSYHWHKILHLFGVILFVGNMFVGPFWFIYAYYSKDVKLLQFSNKLLQVTDSYLTIPGVALTVINGLFLASIYGGTSKQPWLFYSIFLLLIMWALSIPLIYIQEKMYQCIENEPENRIKLNKILVYWGIVGTIVMIPSLLVFYLMLTKSV